MASNVPILPRPPSSNRRRSTLGGNESNNNPSTAINNPSPSPEFDFLEGLNISPSNNTKSANNSNVNNDILDIFGSEFNNIQPNNTQPNNIQTINNEFDFFDSSNTQQQNTLKQQQNQISNAFTDSEEGKTKVKTKKKRNAQSVPDIPTSKLQETEKNLPIQTSNITRDDLELTKSDDKILPPLMIDALKIVKVGIPLLKYGRSGYPHFRLFQLTEDNLAIQFYSKGKSLPETNIPIRLIDKMLHGQQTVVFSRHAAPELNSASFSLVYHGRTLDCIARNPTEYRLFTETIAELMKKTKILNNSQMQNLQEFYISLPRIVKKETSYTNTPFERGKSLSLHLEYDNLTYRIKTLQKKTKLDKIYVHPQYNNIMILLHKIEEQLEKIPQTIEANNYKQADDDTWKCGVEIESLEHMFDAI